MLAVSGNSSDPAILIQAHIARAHILVIATPDSFPVRRIIEIARMLNPSVETVVRTHSDEDAALLQKEHAGKIFMSEHELALGMIRYVLELIAETEKNTLAE
ncbi:protein of unknown function [Candidatus Nitrotoga arctica]|uniref:RCK N-terminal domain-containing protein n=2 Tax=Candidatus Nitrotoga arctica TaxID=453162 RepID=A0ABN8AP93_9PROT|nr:protein of unknown function [Candidatus Nitrotoga arctica]